MNSVRKIFLYFLAISTMIFSGCTLSQMMKLAQEQELTVTPSPLELHADTVKFNIDATLPLKMLKKNTAYTVKVNYKYGDKVQTAGEFMFKSTDFPDAATTQPKLSKEYSFAYSDDMKRGKLYVMGVASTANGKSKATPELPIAEGVITTSKLVKDYNYTVEAFHGYNNQEELIPTTMNFFFLKGSSTLRSSEKRGERGKYFATFIEDSKDRTKNVTITGSHSPEGLESTNSKLAESRATVIKKYYSQMMKRYNYKGKADSITFTENVLFQDWGPFRDSLYASESFSQDEKNEILNIINRPGLSYREQEKSLQSLKTYKKAVKEIYPKLRATTTTVMTIKPKKTDAEISLLAKQIYEGTVSADTLSNEELAYAATLTPIVDEKVKIYEAGIKKSDGWVPHNNLGAIQVAKAVTATGDAKSELVESAINHFKLSLTKNESAEAHANMASALLMRGELEAASKEIAAGMKSASPEIKKGLSSMKGFIEIKMASYDVATSSLNSGVDTSEVKFNFALAVLLNKDYEKAKEAFMSAIEANEKDALSYYGLAVTGARLNDMELVTTNLKKAISMDEKLRAYAIDDLEFSKVWDDEKFKAAVR